MRAGKNVWECGFCGKEEKGPLDGSYPPICKRCGVDDWAAKWPRYRLDCKHRTYLSYYEDTPWGRNANDGMKWMLKKLFT